MTMCRPIELETGRLCLRQWQPNDRAPFAALNADQRVMEYFPSPLDHAASDAMAERCQLLIHERGWGFWAVETKANRQFIGCVGLHIPSAELPFSPCVEVGWRLAYPFWGKGYATEAGKAALEVGFGRLMFAEIVSFTAVGNTKSRAVMERLGMNGDSAIFEHPDVPLGHPLRPHCLYRLSRNQWLAQDGQARPEE